MQHLNMCDQSVNELITSPYLTILNLTILKVVFLILSDYLYAVSLDEIVIRGSYSLNIISKKS